MTAKREKWIRCFEHVINLTVKSALNEIAIDVELRENELQDGERLVLRQVFFFLEDFTVATTYIEASQYPTLSLVVLMYNRLLNLLEEASTDRSKHPLLVKGAAAGMISPTTLHLLEIEISSSINAIKEDILHENVGQWVEFWGRIPNVDLDLTWT
ncbi:hypothetical protein OUZ56_029856 [Daphnia magna]|uniref:Uncharacterized protein n=1 Tax=Daphnia magna TaxID=35525 RepID=A0ABR0B801_9CRUS|nr:hypothetical protein OUZ56_029856 [Daphnia magna]